MQRDWRNFDEMSERKPPTSKQRFRHGDKHLPSEGAPGGRDFGFTRNGQRLNQPIEASTRPAVSSLSLLDWVLPAKIIALSRWCFTRCGVVCVLHRIAEEPPPTFEMEDWVMQAQLLTIHPETDGG